MLHTHGCFSFGLELWCEILHRYEWCRMGSTCFFVALVWLHFHTIGVNLGVNSTRIRSLYFLVIGLMLPHQRCEYFQWCEWLWNEKTAISWIGFETFTLRFVNYFTGVNDLEWEVHICVDWVWHFHTGVVNIFIGVNASGMRSLQELVWRFHTSGMKFFTRVNDSRMKNLHFRGLVLNSFTLGCEFFHIYKCL